MTPKVEYFLFCENVITGERGRISLVNIFDELVVENVPTTIRTLFVALKVTLVGAKKGEQCDFGVSIADPSGKAISTALVQHHTIEDEAINGVNLNIDASSMPAYQYGKYKFDLLLNNEVIDTKYILLREPNVNDQLA